MEIMKDVGDCISKVQNRSRWTTCVSVQVRYDHSKLRWRRASVSVKVRYDRSKLRWQRASVSVKVR